MNKVNVNGIELAYTRQGEGTPLVLLHGFPLDHHAWDEIAPLLENTFDLIIPDLRGFGDSTTVDSVYTMDDLASDIAGLLDQLGIEKSALAGHSMGGYVALAFARLYPERVRGLGLVSTQALADAPDRKEGRYKTAADVAENGIGGVVDAMTTKFTSDVGLQEFSRNSMEAQQPAAYIGALKAMAERQDSTALLESLEYPVVIIHGNEDALIPIDRAHEMKEAIPHAHFVEVEAAGHIPMLEAVKQTAEGLKHLA
ncbi:MAG TPA: alpha/beta hydrolase [Anaerolineales bacterium]|nr:alpha/beta hydrolase [Anaerolineales bacterium]